LTYVSGKLTANNSLIMITFMSTDVTVFFVGLLKLHVLIDDFVFFISCVFLSIVIQFVTLSVALCEKTML